MPRKNTQYQIWWKKYKFDHATDLKSVKEWFRLSAQDISKIAGQVFNENKSTLLASLLQTTIRGKFSKAFSASYYFSNTFFDCKMMMNFICWIHNPLEYSKND